MRLSKSTKIDGCVALSFAVLAAIEHGRPPSFSESSREIRVHHQFDPRTGETIGEATIYKYRSVTSLR